VRISVTRKQSQQRLVSLITWTTSLYLTGHVDLCDQRRLLTEASLHIIKQTAVAHELRNDVYRLWWNLCDWFLKIVILSVVFKERLRFCDYRCEKDQFPFKNVCTAYETGNVVYCTGWSKKEIYFVFTPKLAFQKFLLYFRRCRQ